MATEMSLSIRDDDPGLEYAGGTGGRGLVPSPRGLHSSSRHARRGDAIPPCREEAPGPERAVGARRPDQLRRLPHLPPFRSEIPADVRRSARLRGVVDGARACTGQSRALPAAISRPSRDARRTRVAHVAHGHRQEPDLRRGRGIHAARDPDRQPGRDITEESDGVALDASRGSERFDAAVIATHPAEALSALRSPTPVQRGVLASITYQPNRMTMHTDPSLMPRSPRARASWNISAPRHAGEAVTVTYDTTRLQHLPTPGGKRVYVTLGAGDRIDEASVLARADYAHPLYTPESVSAGARLDEVHTRRIVFAGAYHGWGFHEDGALSSTRAAERLGARWTR